MASCERCGDSTGELAFECDYCSAVYCQSHRLPEKHDCPNISHARPPTSAEHEAESFTDWSRGAESVDEIDLKELRERAKSENKPYSVVEVEETVGTTPEPDLESSPDVAVDGSMASEEDSEESTANGQKSSSKRAIVLIVVILSSLILIAIMFL